MPSKSSNRRRLLAFLAPVIDTSAGLLAAIWSSSQWGIDPMDGGKLEDWPTLRLRIPWLVKSHEAAHTAQPKPQSDRFLVSAPPPSEALLGRVREQAAEIRKPVAASLTTGQSASVIARLCEPPALPIRHPGRTMRHDMSTPSVVTLRVLSPTLDEELATLFIGVHGSSPLPPVTVYRDGTVDTRRTALWLPNRTGQPTSELIPQSDRSALQSRAVQALEARQAALAGHDSLVEAFAADVLGLARSARWREAVSTALLGDWVEPLFSGQRLDDAAVTRLRAEARITHRHLVPLWRRRTRHGRVLLLDTPLGDGLSLHDLASGITDTEAPLLEHDPEDARLAALIRALRPAERAAALAWADPNVRSWTEAAQQAGVDDPIAFGERVRRKCRRLAAELARRRSLTVHAGGESA
ncbi:hypothetical protein ABZZ46_33640 [Streptomyces rochei]|uniref:hypothetical protein n=1 Tax=Streptomyces rochei TaxID=1928 RepID=UPI0033BC95E4